MAERTLPLVTIAIPTYARAASYLPQALTSAVRQTYPRLDIIVADNGSPDETAAVVAGFADPRLRYFRHPTNIGANANFNFCLAQARGDYFLLLQDDDTIDLDFIDACLTAAGHQTGVGIVRTGTRLIDADGTVWSETLNRVGGLSLDGFFLGWFTHQTALYLCSTLFNTRRLAAIGGFHSRHHLFQDVMATVQLAAQGGRVDVSEVKASFRKHSQEMTYAARVGDWCEDSLLLLDLMCDLAADPARIRREGMRFFAGLNYGRATAVASPRQRARASLQVFRTFRHPPRRGHFYRLLYGPRLHGRVRVAKRALRSGPASVGHRPYR